MKQKRILHVFNVLNRGGAETFVYNVYKNIDRNKFKFDFLVQSQEEGAYEKEFKQMGSDVFHLKSFNNLRPLKVIKDSVIIIKQNGPYDAIHIPMQFYSPVYCIAAKIAGIKKIIVHSHSANDKNGRTISRKIYRTAMRLLINMMATAKISCGQKAAEFLFGSNKNVTIIYNGIDMRKINKIKNKDVHELRRKMNISNELVIGNVARFEKVKNQQFFIEIAKCLKRRNIKFKILLIGNGSTFKEIKNTIISNELEDNFILTGEVSNALPYYRLIDIFVLPSLYEGFPTVVEEALASGVPCLLSEGVTNEIANLSKTCYYADLKDGGERWADRIIEIVKNNTEVVFNNYNLFDIKRTVTQIENIYLS